MFFGAKLLAFIKFGTPVFYGGLCILTKAHSMVPYQLSDHFSVAEQSILSFLMQRLQFFIFKLNFTHLYISLFLLLTEKKEKGGHTGTTIEKKTCFFLKIHTGYF